jgi:hypothetical protein
MPASRRASSKEVRRSRCFPTPLVKKIFFGTMSLPNSVSSRKFLPVVPSGKSNTVICEDCMKKDRNSIFPILIHASSNSRPPMANDARDSSGSGARSGEQRPALRSRSGRVRPDFAGRQRDDCRFHQIAEIGKSHPHQFPVRTRVEGDFLILQPEPGPRKRPCHKDCRRAAWIRFRSRRKRPRNSSSLASSTESAPRYFLRRYKSTRNEAGTTAMARRPSTITMTVFASSFPGV